MFILEGPGNVGKTTAAKYLAQGAFEYRHMGKPSPEFNFFSDYAPMIELHAIRDRFHLGGHVWHDTLETGLSQTRMDFIVQTLQSLGCYTVVLCAYDSEWYEKQWIENQRDSETWPLSIHLNANEKYKDLPPHWSDVVHYVDVDGFPDHTLLRQWREEWLAKRRLADEFRRELTC